ncbi:hypothetical protein SAMN05216522_106189 [Rosenbergiella nectarea]|uniref:Pilus assembly protein CpaB n=1 Tax=Rosenbergiella nectarea TaxID=988801 RepID=A0A1H9IUL6_9GAMM|nr:hypothetical protein [Rosenbergiella nectarea]SEQ78226.1 hypothetical protein SAMN05216522_106189 [Rosenbergiella nectarea]
MNQRLIIIVSIILFLLGIVGIYLSDSGDDVSADGAQQQATPRVTYFITKRIMAAGELITKADYEEKTEDVSDPDQVPETVESVEGYYLTESVKQGTTLTKALLTQDKPVQRQSNELYRFTIDLNRKYINNLYGLLPGADVDVYLRFESPKREHDNKSTIFRGESVVKIVKLFKNKKLLTPVMKGSRAFSEEENNSINASTILDNKSEEYTVDIELTRSDLKKIYQIENKYEIIVFPAESVVSGKSVSSAITKGAK